MASQKFAAACVLAALAFTVDSARIQRAQASKNSKEPGTDSIYCQGGNGITSCPRSGDNHFSANGGGACKFRYTYHTGTGADTDAAVVTSGQCNVTAADLDTGSKTNRRTRAWVRSLAAHDGFELDDAGHILASRLGGCGNCPVNLFPQNLNRNRGVYRRMEGDIAECIANGATSAQLSWKFNYKRRALEHMRPDSYTYTAKFTGGNCADMEQTFDNPRCVRSEVDDLVEDVE